MSVSVGEYLLLRLSELRIEHLFGVPGDYNLLFLDDVHGQIEWVGNCNELNAAYAADGYARVRGAGALLTTFGVGELSAINGIAGAYAEFVPIVHIVGAPALSTQSKHALVHHTFGTGDFSVFSNIYKFASVDQALLTPENATTEIDRVLRSCWIKKQPVYICLPSDVVSYKVPRPVQKLNLDYPNSNMDAVAEFVSRSIETIKSSRSPVVLIDICAVRHSMRDFIIQFVEKTGIPFANLNMGKCLLNEYHPKFIGSYSGVYSLPVVKDMVETSDCVIAFGFVLSDLNTGGFTAKINPNATIEIHSCFAKLHQSIYPDVYFNVSLPELISNIEKHAVYDSVIIPVSTPALFPDNLLLSHARFWNLMTKFFKDRDIVVGEVGTSLFGLLSLKFPNFTTFISQTLWGSIGYSVGALLGAALADKTRRPVLFVGDGSFQLTGQELCTFIRHKLPAVVFLINNDGYTIERMIHGPSMAYNDIEMWDYTAFVKSLSVKQPDFVWTARISNELELQHVFQELEQFSDKLCFVEVLMEKMDSPDILRNFAADAERRNKK